MSILDKKILVIDDDENICDLIRLYFEDEGARVVCCHSGIDAAGYFLREQPDMILLDLMLPGKDGYDICREVRRQSNVPIIILTARGDTLDKVVGLELGADDYVQKPFDSKELLARAKAVLRRAQPQEPELRFRVIDLPGLRIDKEAHDVEILGRSVSFPPKELDLLYFLAAHPDRVFSREQLLGNVWGYDFLGDSRTVDVHIKRIREKIDQIGTPEHWEIKTIWRVGYKFRLNESESET